MRDHSWKYKRRTKPTGYSRVTLRLKTTLLNRLAAEAQRRGISMDAVIVNKLEAI